MRGCTRRLCKLQIASVVLGAAMLCLPKFQMSGKNEVLLSLVAGDYAPICGRRRAPTVKHLSSSDNDDRRIPRTPAQRYFTSGTISTKYSNFSIASHLVLLALPTLANAQLNTLHAKVALEPSFRSLPVTHLAGGCNGKHSYYHATQNKERSNLIRRYQNNANFNEDDVNVGRDNNTIEYIKDDVSKSLSSTPNLPSVKLFALLTFVIVTISSYITNVKFGSTPVNTLVQDVVMSLVCAILAFSYVKVVTTLASQGILERKVSRKIIHIGSAPLFMLLWPFFSSTCVGDVNIADQARLFASTVPLINAYRLYLAGMDENKLRQGDLINALSRSGNAREALGGPFAYVLVLLACTLLFWRDNMMGIMALCTMAGGDGMADIVGRRYGKNNKWFFNKNKSVAGTVAFVSGSFTLSTVLSAWFIKMGVLSLSMSFDHQIRAIALVCFLTSLVELLPFGDDNWTVPISGAVLAALLLR